MNLPFFYTAGIVYLIAAVAYGAYFIKPERPRTADIALWLTAAAFLLHAAYFSLRWVESGRVPITGFFEAINFLGMGIVLVFLIMEFRFKIPTLGSFMLPLVIVLILPAAVMSGKIEELKPILKSGWLGIHTSLAVLGDAAFAFAFIVSIMYLIQERQLKAKRLGALFHRMPPLDVMDMISARALPIGWVLFTFGMVTGAIWAESAWGSYWSWEEPKEMWSLFTWLIYLVLLHLRTIGWRGRKMAYLAIAGFVFVLVSFFVISRTGAGKHIF